MTSKLSKQVRVVFTEGGKGGIGKTEAVSSLISWYQARGVRPALLDFDIENSAKSGLQNFYPGAQKTDVHQEGALDQFFDVCDRPETEVIVADLGSGAGEATFRWFEEASAEAADFNMLFTAIALTTNDAGAVQSVLKWADRLQDRVEYLVILNEMSEFRSEFEYWHDEPGTRRFIEAFDPVIVTMQARIAEFQAELRNQSATLQNVIEGVVEAPFLKKAKNLMRAKRYQRHLFAAFDQAAAILLP